MSAEGSGKPARIRSLAKPPGIVDLDTSAMRSQTWTVSVMGRSAVRIVLNMPVIVVISRGHPPWWSRDLVPGAGHGVDTVVL